MLTRRKRLALSPAGVAILFSALALLTYAANVAFPFVIGPELSVEEPSATAHGTTRIAGATKRVSKVTVNDFEVPITEAGAFSVERAYPNGYTVVVVRALDRFGRQREEKLTFITRDNNDTQ